MMDTRSTPGSVSPDFPKASEIRLALGEMTAAEMRVAVAAIRWVLSTRSESERTWIPCSERLPSPTAMVLAFHRNGYSVKHGANLYADVKHVEAGLLPFYTHWMPLPKGPK